MTTLLEQYEHIVTEPRAVALTLTPIQQAAILDAYDCGIRAVNSETLAVLDSVMNELKELIHR